jgi:hypothetical protein
LYYFEHCIAKAGLYAPGRVAILRVVTDERVYDDLRAELRDAFPDAQVAVVGPDEVAAGTDLVILPLLAPYEFPYHDVVYDRLHELEPLRRAASRAAFVMLYRVLWREVEVFRAGRWPARLRKLRLEAALIRLCRRSALVRRLLRTHYPC